MVVAAQLVGKVVIDGADTAKSKLEGVSKATDSTQASVSKFSSLAKGAASIGIAALGGAAVALGGALVSTIKPAADFEATMLQISATNDVTKQQVDQLSDSLLNMAGKVGKGPQELAEGLYYVMGAGYESAEAMDILERSAKAVAGTTTDTTVVANALTATLKAFPGLSVAQTMDMMTAAVATGKTEWEDYGPAIGKVSLMAQFAGANFQEANAALSTLTNTMPSTEQAATSLSALFQTSSRFTELADRAANLGIAFDANAYKSMNFIDRLKYLQQVTNGNSEAVGKLLGSEEALPAITALLTDGAKGYATALDSVTNSAGKADKAFDTKSEGAAATWARATEAAKALQVQVGDALLPAVTLFADKIAPMIMNIMKWIKENQVLEKGISAVGTAFNTIVSIGSSVVSFFQNNQIAMALLIGTLTAVGVLLAAFGVMVLVSLVPAFIAWAVAAGAAAIATLAATWPILAIGALIALVVAGIILAVQNWGAITAWFQGIWGAFTSWLMEILGAIGAFFVGVWNGIVAGLQAAWNFIVAIVQAGVQLLLMAVLGPFIAIGQAFVWLYNHNYYFKALVDFIVNIFKVCFTWLQSAWNATIGWLGGLWNGLLGLGRMVWAALTFAIMSVVGAVVGWLRGVWQGAVNWLGSVWNTLRNLAQNAWNAVTGVFRSAWGMISGPLNSLWNNISNTVGGWAGKFLQFGKNLIQNFINGIRGMLSAVGNAAKEIAGKVASFLGFHSPTKEGPGRLADTWAPAFVRMFAGGIEAGIPQIERAVSQLMRPIDVSLNPIGANFSGSLEPSSTTGPIMPASLRSGPTIVYVTSQPDIFLDGQKLTDHVMNRAVKGSRSGPIRSSL